MSRTEVFTTNRNIKVAYENEVPVRVNVFHIWIEDWTFLHLRYVVHHFHETQFNQNQQHSVFWTRKTS